MITTVTLNPMLDKTVHLQRIAVGQITRADQVSSIVGGKGVNVARQLHRLGCPVQATGVWGGEVGAQLDRLLTAEGVPHHFVPIGGMTREGVTYLDAEGGMTCVFEPPHTITPAEADALLAQCRTLLSDSTWLACCGSSPAASSDHVYADLVRDARAHGVRSALDSYGLPLRLALEALPDVLKVNRDEYENTIGVSLELEHHIVDALITRAEQGIGLTIITDGPRPCYAASSFRMLEDHSTACNERQSNGIRRQHAGRHPLRVVAGVG